MIQFIPGALPPKLKLDGTTGTVNLYPPCFSIILDSGMRENGKDMLPTQQGHVEGQTMVQLSSACENLVVPEKAGLLFANLPCAARLWSASVPMS